MYGRPCLSHMAGLCLPDHLEVSSDPMRNVRRWPVQFPSPHLRPYSILDVEWLELGFDHRACDFLECVVPRLLLLMKKAVVLSLFADVLQRGPM